MPLPEITQEPIIYVDATPDEGYPLRILRAYRENCNCKWKDTTNSNSTENLILRRMNENCDKRAALLDKAIAILEVVSIVKSFQERHEASQRLSSFEEWSKAHLLQ